jgi:hypothetical protein
VMASNVPGFEADRYVQHEIVGNDQNGRVTEDEK